jgi:hypothetical protein
VHGRDDLGQHVGAAAAVVELAAAVVGYIHAVDPVLAGERRILGGRDCP